MNFPELATYVDSDSTIYYFENVELLDEYLDSKPKMKAYNPWNPNEPQWYNTRLDIFQHEDYGGVQRSYQLANLEKKFMYESYTILDLNDRITSFIFKSDTECKVRFYTDAYFNGATLTFTITDSNGGTIREPNIGKYKYSIWNKSWNDKASSIRIYNQ